VAIGGDIYTAQEDGTGQVQLTSKATLFTQDVNSDLNWR
jgi:hypothetical protein